MIMLSVICCLKDREREFLLSKMSTDFTVLSLQMKSEGAFRVLVDNYVTDDSGTGVVHSAPAFGEVYVKLSGIGGWGGGGREGVTQIASNSRT